VNYNGSGPMKGKTPPESTEDQELIHRHIEFIEKQCVKAVRMKRSGHSPRQEINLENEALELSGRVLDQLTKNNYQVLHQFENKAKFTTYLTTIIANQSIDMIRKKKGRSREKDRAREFGDIGIQIYQKIVVQGLSVEMAYQELLSLKKIATSETEFLRMVDRIKGSGRNPGPVPDPNDNLIRMGSQDSQTGEMILPETRNNPEETVIKNSQQQQIDRLLLEILEELNGEEQLIIRMRFPANPDQDSESIEAIARIMDISPKAVYKRISRVLKKCREKFEKKGIRSHDLL